MSRLAFLAPVVGPQTIPTKRGSVMIPGGASIALGEELDLQGFSHLPRPGDGKDTVATYSLAVSTDGEDPSEQVVRCDAVRARLLKLVAKSDVDGRPWASPAEIGVFVEGR